MRKLLLFSLLFLSLGFFFSCRQDNALDKKIALLEASYAKNPTPGGVDSLFRFYNLAIQKYPDNPNTFRYLVKMAEIEFLVRQKGPEAVAYLDKALRQHGAGQNLTEAIGLFARIRTAREYHKAPASYFKPEEIDLIDAYLANNTVWIDSSLQRLDRAMTAANGAVNDEKAANAFIETAEGYALIVQDKQPDKAVDLILKAAGVAKSVGNPKKAIQLYYQVAEKMPTHAKAPTALFMMGFIYENDLSDLEQAKKTYEDFLKKYPNDPDYADDAQNALKLLGKSPEEIIREFEKNNPPTQ